MKINHLIGLLVLSISVSAYALEDAEKAMNEWRPDLALEHLDADVREDDARWHRMRGTALMSLGENEEGIHHLEKAMELAPEDAESHWFWMQALTAQINDSGVFGMLGLARDIRDTLETAVELDPDNPEYRYGLLQYYIQAPGIAGGSTRKARKQREILAEMDPRWGEAADALFLLDDGDSEAGLEKLLAAWDNGDGVEQMAMPIVFNAQGQEQWDTARTTLKHLLDRKPGHPAALYQVGRTAALSGEHLEEGFEALERYLELPFISPSRPSRAATFWRIGQLHLHAGDRDKARLAWQQSLELDPEFEDAQASLSELGAEDDDEQS